MKHAICSRHPSEYPCACAMGNIYRFVEPVVLYMLRENGATHGYQLTANLQHHALTDAAIEGAALYRTLRRLEEHGYVESTWDTQSGGPARRIYTITRDGRTHLEDWAHVMDHLSRSMVGFVSKIKQGGKVAVSKPAKPARRKPKQQTASVKQNRTR